MLNLILTFILCQLNRFRFAHRLKSTQSLHLVLPGFIGHLVIGELRKRHVDARTQMCASI